MGHPVHWMIIDKGTLVISGSLMTGQRNGSLIGLMNHLGQKMKDFIVQAGRAFGFIEMAGHGADYLVVGEIFFIRSSCIFGKASTVAN